jgi:hypothetical protein
MTSTSRRLLPTLVLLLSSWYLRLFSILCALFFSICLLLSALDFELVRTSAFSSLFSVLFYLPYLLLSALEKYNDVHDGHLDHGDGGVCIDDYKDSDDHDDDIVYMGDHGERTPILSAFNPASFVLCF